MPEIGITITAKDAASGVLKGMGGVAKKSLGSVRAVADKAKNAFSVFGKVATGVNQALEIGRKAWGALQMVVGQTVAKALEFRAAGDPVRKWFADMKRDTDLLKASIGDALIPVIQGLAEGLGLVGRGARDWVRENRKVIASGLLEFVLKTGEVLTKSVAKGTLLVVKAWKGWQQIIDGVKAAGQAAFGAMLSGAATAVEAMADVVSVFDEDLARGMMKAAAEAQKMGEAFSANSQETIDAMFRTDRELNELEASINRVSGVALKKLERAGVIAQKKIQESTVGTNRTLDEQKQASKDAADQAIKSAARIEKFLEARHAARIKRLEIYEAFARQADERMTESAEKAKELENDAISTMTSVADTISTTMADAVATFAEGTIRANQMMDDAQQAVAEGASDATEKMNAAREAQGAVAGNVAKQTAMAVIDSVTAAVSALAVQAAAGAFASMASIPYIGPALGAAAAAAASAAVMALGAGLKGLISGMADGGVVTGGAAGRDSVPVMLMPGEQVMSVAERQGMQKFMTRLLSAQAGHAAIGLSAAGAASTGGQPVVVNQKTELRTWVPSIVEETKMARRMEKGSKKRLQRQGMLLGQGGVV